MIYPHRLVEIREVAELCLGKMLDRNKNQGSYRKYLGNSDVRWGNFNLRNLSEMKFSDAELDRYGIIAGDLIVCEGGEPGRCAIWQGQIPTMMIQKALHRVRGKQGLLDNRYLYYWLTYAAKQGILESSFTGTTIKHLTSKALGCVKFPLPKMGIQEKIIELIEPLDKKIELNTAINTNLEEQLQAAFQSKFTANASPGLPGKLSDICHYSYAKIAVSELSLNNYYSTENMLPAKGGATRASSLPAGGQTPRCVKGDVLVSNIRPYFKKIVYAHSLGGCSPDVLCFNAAHSELSAYLFCTLYSDRFFAHMVAGTKGTKMPRGDKQQIMAYPIIVPSKDALSDFNALAFPIIEACKVLDDENKTLAKTRDVLLPKLMSGEIDVSEVEVSFEQ